MTLSRFLRDYLYFPLGGNRHGKGRRYVNLMLTMLLGGLWHGAGWTFLLWGGLHGFYLIVNHGWHAVKPKVPVDRVLFPLARRFFALVLTFLAVVVSWVFFRAETFDAALVVLAGMSDVNSIVLPQAFKWSLGGFSNVLSTLGIQFGMIGGKVFVLSWVWLLLGCLVVSTFPNTYDLFSRYIDLPEGASNPSEAAPSGFLVRYCGTWSPNNAWALCLSLMAVLSILSLTRISEFLYFQF